ncbi:MAG: translocation/assembly module TamB [Candidatus Azobacteroides sp.]|nr:translocation/assembly module TamB [Candidatus Azobacteroides sp.]
MQQRVTSFAVTQLTKKLNTEIRIGKTHFDFLSGITLEDVYIEDQQQDTLLFAAGISAGIELLPLLKKKIVFSNAQLYGFQLNLKKDNPQDQLNLQFIIDAFKKEDKQTEPSVFDLRFNSVFLRRGNIHYDVLSEAGNSNKFDPHHIGVSKLGGTFSIKKLSNDSLNLDLRRLSFEEKSGFILNKLSFKLVANKQRAYLTHLNVKLPDTELKSDTLTVDYQLEEDDFNWLNHSDWSLKIEPSFIALKDFAAFVPAFGNFSDVVSFSTYLKGTPNDFTMDYLSIEAGENLFINAGMEMKNVFQKDEAFLLGKIDRLYISAQKLTDIIRDFSNGNASSPSFLNNLGLIEFHGDVSGYLDDMVAYGNFSTLLGGFSTDLMMGRRNDLYTFRGALKTNEFRLGELLEKQDILGNVAFELNLDANLLKGSSRPTGFVKGIISEIEIKKYAYHNIELDGNFSNIAFDGKISLNDPNGRIALDGLFDFNKELPLFNLNVMVEELRLGELNLTDKYKTSELSFELQANFQGSNIHDSFGLIEMRNIDFKNNGEEALLKNLEVKLDGFSPERKLSVRSDILNGEIKGSFNFQRLGKDLQDIVSGYLPVFFTHSSEDKITVENVFSGFFMLENTEKLSTVLNLPVTIMNQSVLLLDVNSNLEKIKLEAYLPKSKIQNNYLESTRLLVDNPSKNINVSVTTKRINPGKNTFVDLSFEAKAMNDSIFADIRLCNNDTVRHTDVSIRAVTDFHKDPDDQLITYIYLSPSQITLNNTSFSLQNSMTEIYKGKIRIEDFALEGENEYIRINGIYSNTSQDVLYMDLNNANLEIIETITNNSILAFGGLATGKFTIIGKEEGLPVLSTELFVKDLAYNRAVLGDLNIYSKWDESNQGILLDGDIIQPEYLPTKVYGHIFPTKDSLNLRFNANHINLRLLEPFVENVMTDFSGWAYGNIHMYGNFGELSFVGTPYIQDINFGIEFLNTFYSFSDTLYMTEDAFRLQNTVIYDRSGNTAQVNAVLSHDHFKDFNYRISLRTSNFHIFNATQKQNPLFFGSVYGSGNAILTGDLDRINVDVNMRSERNSRLTLSFFDNISASTLDFITFVRKDTLEVLQQSVLAEEAGESAFEMLLNLQIEATPDATVQLIMDPQSGDILRGTGAGNMRLTYNSRTDDMSLYGTYTIEQGNYNFTWEELIKKDFTLRSGSTVSFRGDPYDASLDITAVHSLYADISSLEYSLSEESGRQNIPVDVLIKITGNLERPEITPSIELPSSGEDIRRKVSSLIYTQNDVTKQVFYLLLFGQFDAPDHVSVSNNTSQLASVVSSTLSSQLNTFLSQVSNKINIGTNIQSRNRGGIQDLEFGLNISTQIFDNRVILKSNLGYRENDYQSNNFIGDFDLEYKLTRSGDIRLKGYSHYNDNSLYYGRSGLTTQGIGIMYTKDFNNLKELFRRSERRQLRRNQEASLQEETEIITKTGTDSIQVQLPENK